MSVQPIQTDLAARREKLLAAEPKLRAYDVAQKLGVGEAALLPIDDSAVVTRLKPEFAAMLARFKELGRVMALTRNESVVHERKGVYQNFSAEGGHVGLVLGPDIDLRLFLGQWKLGYAVAPKDAQRRPSLQFFDASGDAVHKVHALEDTDMAVWNRLVADFAASAEIEAPVFTARAAKKAEKPDAEIDAKALRDGWKSLKDTHEFFGLVRKVGASRLQAMRLAGTELAQPLAASDLRATLELASAGGTSIMVFVGNPGCIQIHTGPVSKIVPMGTWINVMDPTFNLHLREDRIGSVWLVRKPTEDGVVTSVEVFDKQGENIAMLFGARKPGKPELPEWRALAESLVGRAAA